MDVDTMSFQRNIEGALEAVAAWISRYRKFWEGQFDALEDYLATMDAEEENHDRDAGGTRRVD